MEGGNNQRERKRARKIIGEDIKNYFALKGLSIYMIYIIEHYGVI